MTGTALIAATNTRMRMDVKTTFPEADEPMDQTLLAIGEDLWIRMPLFEELLPEGKSWVHMVEETAGLNSMTASDYARFVAGADEVEKRQRGPLLHGSLGWLRLPGDHALRRAEGRRLRLPHDGLQRRQ